MLTPSDLRNPKRRSGYDRVRFEDVPGRPKPYAANANPIPSSERPRLPNGRLGGRSNGWEGPHRATAEEAAQDYCDYVNGNGITPATKLPTITHKRPKRRKRPAQPQHIAEKRQEVRAWDREVAAAQPVTNHVYLMAVQGDRQAVKIGESYEPLGRAAEGQTWHHRPVIVLGFLPTDIPRDADKPVHARFARHHIANEWFRPALEVLSYFGVSSATFFRKTATPRRQAA